MGHDIRLMRLRLLAISPPLILSAYAVLVFLSGNITQIEIREILPILGKVIVGTSLCIAMLALVLRDAKKVGIIGSLIVIFVLFYGQIYAVYDYFLGGSSWVKLFFPACTLLFIVTAWFCTRTDDRTQLFSTLVLVISVILISVPTFHIVRYQLFERANYVEYNKNESVALNKELGEYSTKRSIYYLIFDRYAANRTLKRDYEFDNNDFLSFLISKGFFVASESTANYTKTAHSLASSLNMDYLDGLSEDTGGDSNDWTPVYRMLKDFKVWKLLKGFGYRYIHLGSWWEPTRQNKFADENYGIDPASEFEQIFLRNTALLPVSKVVDMPGFLAADERKKQCERILYKFEKLNELAGQKGPFFVFAHMLIPHPPYVFDAKGRCLSGNQVKDRTRAENYIGQVRYTNGRLEQLITRLLSMNPKPIVIIQSDEGPFPERYRESVDNFDWRSASKKELQKKFRILNALYLPGFDHRKLYAQMTPVNTFRLIFSEYYGLDYKRLPDRSLSFVDANHLYDFFDVTKAVE